MEALRTWALTVAIAALAGGIVRLLAPRGSVEKALRCVVAVFLLAAFLSPMFGRGGVSLDWVFPELAEPPTISALEMEVMRQVQTAVEAELRTRMERVLAARHLEGQILLSTDILSDGSIEIVTAQVVLPPGSAAGGLAAQLKAETQLDVEIVTA